MENAQFSALTALLNFCRRAIRTENVDVNEWQQLRVRMNKEFVTSGPPRIKATYGLISDLMKGVPVEVVRKRYKVSRGTVYRMIKEHPELAKIWEDKKKKRHPELVPDPIVDLSQAEPTTPPLPDVLLQFLVFHEPLSAKIPVGPQRFALECLLSKLGLVPEEEFNSMNDEELVARVTVYQSDCEDHPDVAEQPIESPGDGVVGARPDDTDGTATSPQAVLDKFLAKHRPTIASSKTIHPAVKRMMLLVAMVEEGLGDPDDLDLLDDEALANMIAESEHQGREDGSRESS